MRKVIRRLLMVLGILILLGIVVFLCRDPIVNTFFYDMDSEMDLPDDIKNDPKYAPDSSSKRNEKDGAYEIKGVVDEREFYSLV